MPLRILLADADPRRRAALAHRLGSLGHTVMAAAEDGRAALESARRLHPDVIFAAADLPAGVGELAEAALAEAIAPVVLVLEPGFAEPVTMAGVWGCIPSCAGGPVVDGVITVAARLFRERRALETSLRSVEQRLYARQVVERAKGLLMDSSGLSEAEAYRCLRKRSMDTGRPLGEVAEAVLLAGGITRG
jgi:response regulator NasT